MSDGEDVCAVLAQTKPARRYRRYGSKTGCNLYAASTAGTQPRAASIHRSTPGNIPIVPSSLLVISLVQSQSLLHSLALRFLIALPPRPMRVDCHSQTGCLPTQTKLAGTHGSLTLSFSHLPHPLIWRISSRPSSTS